ncbi:hypothetical protein H310_01744 [Aphanomyces invadans]|uniref:VLIG-type G domain-containing protein n=1 Tax=Aphanomyces invadans TaxID=157072 RepID=A0A024UKX1_9STRA|nr:hypothetical protein H310_01744 [Aphanomyces invadans]ETW07101.1 hypothetical protein H310_01744 [Aphanomyces invadans]|eukprot:XP_008863194.1 hypothetical protein H310_01744 [Aphanomyces invadans]
MRDVAALRVVVVSDRDAMSSVTKDWIKNVFHIQSVHALDRVCSNRVTQRPCVAELGWGFVKQGSKFETVMVLHVIGEYHRLDTFIEAFADAIVIDVGQDGGSNVPMRRGCVLKWQHSNEDEDDEDVSEDGSVVTTIEMRCPISSSYASIQEYLFMYGMPEKGAAGRVPVPEIAAASTALVPTRPAAVSAAAVCLATDFASFRTHTLKLQRIFVEEAKLMIMYHRETNVANKEMHLEKARQLRQHNTQISRVVQDHPLIAHFIEALKHQSPVARERAIIDLELHLAASSERASETARHEYRRARDAVNRAKTRATQQAYVDALETWGLMVTGLEHLWRELSHMFVGSPREYGHFPELAAMHLLDGFPMELMDGDAAMVNLKWITAILNKLEDKLPTARIFVLSIMGVQSAGKSTLLNYMFGVRLRTSVSRCTRGVSLQLLQCDGRAEYDYILLLDTEGIRSPEYIGTEGSVWRDNRMATLAILPSDATIILTKGESTVTISEILPIVLSVFLDSELTEKHRGQLASKFYFVFNQIDTSQSTNMETIVDTLLRNLRSNAKKIQAIRGNPMATSDDEEESSIKYFSQFQVDIKDEDASDVRFLGTIKGSSEPPDDAPTPQYGKRLLKFRDYIHDRASHYVGATGQLVKNRPWTGRLVREFNDDLTRVWECINQSNFQMDFLAAHERVSYDELIRIMTQHKQHLARAYSEAFDTVLQHICDDNANNVRVDEHSRKYEHKLKQEVQPAVFRLDTLACADLDADKFAKWKLDQEIKWQNHKINQEAHTLRLVKDKVNQVFLYDIHVKKYKEMLYDEITTKFRDAGNRGATKTKFHLTDKAFEDLFERLMYKAKADHPPVAPTVCPAIYELFVHGGLFNPKQLSFLHQQRRRGPTARVDVVRMRRANDTILLQSTEATQLEVQEYVRSLLVDTQRYSQDVATDCILQTKEFLAKLRLPNTTYDACVPVLYTTLVSQFKAIQEKWDEENSVSAKFATCKPVMKKFAQHLCSGHKAADLLIATLDDWIANHLSKAVAEEVVSSVASTLKHEPWVSDARSMQAYLDHSLLCEMKAKRIDNVLRWLQSPTDHSALVIQGLIQAKVKECFGTAADTIVTTMKTCVTTAATDAATFDRDRSKRFIVALRHSLQKALKGSGRSVLVENLPNADDDVMNCDHHGPTIFTTSKDVNVLTSTMQSLERHKAALRPSNYTTAELADGILKMIRTEAYGASSGVVPRCGMPCPRCFCPCTKALGHKLSDDPNEALHDTYHQPKGIIGSYKVETGQLVAGTCPAAVEKDVYMVLEGGDRSFREFDKVYPGWAIPTKQEPLPLREYIFATYQAQLAEMHNKAKCVRIPREYYHDLDDITRKIQRLLHKN